MNRADEKKLWFFLFVFFSKNKQIKFASENHLYSVYLVLNHTQKKQQQRAIFLLYAIDNKTSVIYTLKPQLTGKK